MLSTYLIGIKILNCIEAIINFLSIPTLDTLYNIYNLHILYTYIVQVIYIVMQMDFIFTYLFTYLSLVAINHNTLYLDYTHMHVVCKDIDG